MISSDARGSWLHESRMSPGILWRGGEEKAYLTFDDGPAQDLTPRLLDLLAEFDVKATFFLIGERARRNPGITRRIHEDGHTIGNHSYSHPRMWRQSKAKLEDELSQTDRILEDVTGRKPVLLRPPYGKFGLNLMLAVKRTNHRIVLWNYSLRDYKAGVAAHQIHARIEKIRPRQIVLAHDGHDHSHHMLTALTHALPGLKRKGLQFAALGNGR